MKKSQFSVEFLAIFGFIFLMSIPLIIIFFDEMESIKDSIASNHIRNIAIKLSDKAEVVYYLGEPTKTTLTVYFPERIEKINISGNLIMFYYKDRNNNIQEIYEISNVNLSGTLSTSPGPHRIFLTARDDDVLIGEVT